MNWQNFLRSLRRSWWQHAGMQIMTLLVLFSTYSVIIFVFAFSGNLKNILHNFSDSLQMTVYVQEAAVEEEISNLKTSLSNIPEVKKVEFVSKETAASKFKKQMTQLSAELLNDAEFSNPFPASFELNLKAAVSGVEKVSLLESLAGQITKLKGVEEVSYGQNWVKNYSSFVRVIELFAWIIISILVVGSVFVIGNSIRALVASRREEIEILELVGATSKMIRSPFVYEGAFLGFLATSAALLLNYVLYRVGTNLIGSNLIFARLLTVLEFLNPLLCFLILFLGTGLGAAGSWLVVNRLNTGWSAAQRNTRYEV